MDRNLNKDWRKRDALIFGAENVRDRYDIRHYDDMDPDTLRRLVADGYADRDDTQNSAPSIGEFLDATARFPQMRFHGYVVSPEREDYRVSVEGFIAPYSPDIVNEYHSADEFTVDPTDNTVRAWWD